jgi:hypothetical protein
MEKQHARPHVGCDVEEDLEVLRKKGVSVDEYRLSEAGKE